MQSPSIGSTSLVKDRFMMRLGDFVKKSWFYALAIFIHLLLFVFIGVAVSKHLLDSTSQISAPHEFICHKSLILREVGESEAGGGRGISTKVRVVAQTIPFPAKIIQEHSQPLPTALIVVPSKEDEVPLPIGTDVIMDRVANSENAFGHGNFGGQGNGFGKGFGNETGNGIGNGKGKGLFGMKIDSNRLCVILDISGSMQRILPQVSREIRKQFPDAIILFSPNCQFTETADSYFNTNDSNWLTTIVKRVGFKDPKEKSFFETMGLATAYAVEYLDIDGLWIFTDFQDAVDPEMVSELEGKIANKGIKLYLHSVELPPNSHLLRISKDSNGDCTIKKLKDGM